MQLISSGSPGGKRTGDRSGDARIPLRVLILEDSPHDLEICLLELKKGGFEVQADIVETRDAFISRLNSEVYDIILSDYGLPTWNGSDAFYLVQTSGKDVPFILVTGTLGEEAAVELIKQGVTDCVFKDRIARLPVAVRRALEEKALRDENNRTTQALRENEESYRKLIEQSPDAVLVHRRGRIIFANGICAVLFGASRVDELFGKQYLDLVHPEDRGGVEQRIEKYMHDPAFVRRNETKFLRLDGTAVHLEVAARSVIYRGEAAIQVICRDVSQRKHSEYRLQRSEASLAAAQRMAHLGSFEYDLTDLKDLDKAPVQWSDEVFRIFGYEPGQIEPSRPVFLRAVHPHDRDRLQYLLAEAIKERRSYRPDYRVIRPDGTERIVHGEAEIIYDANTGKPLRVVGIVQDITQRKQSEERIRRLAQAVEHSRELIAMGDREGRVTFANRAFLQTLGYSEEEVIGKPFSMTVLSRKNRPGLEEEMRRAILENREWKGECLHRRKDGSDFPVYLSVGPLTDSAGSVIGSMGIAQDVTERKKLEEQFRQAQKMEAVGRLSGGIAHDFNNLLGVIIGYSELVEERLSENDGLRRKVTEIKKAGQRAASLTRQLLAFSRQQVLEPRVLALNTVVVDIEKMLRRLIGEDIELATVLAPNLANVKADRGQMEQVIMNLVVNARDAMPHGGKIIIETKNIEVDETYAHQHGHVSPGEFVMLAVTDTGVGMDTETQSHIFEPFFTTKELGKGTGLGLATVYGVVKQSSGFIWVYSEPGHGTTFKILLPRVEKPVQETERNPNTDGQQRGSETILLVEDDAALRELTLTLLAQQGYTVLAAANGHEALNIAQDRPQGQIHLLLTDVVMPGMSGPQVADELSVTHPDMKVLFTSGYTEFAVGHEQIARAGRFLLQKPFTQRELTSKVREVLQINHVPVVS
jgi:two-component system cell cycle sensor histidine kinase/response regulator CckA